MRPTVRFCLLLTAAFLIGTASLASAAPHEAILESAIGLPADIAFDGYCDGVHLAAGPHGSIQGNRTGCATDALIGAPGARGGVGVSFNETGFLYYYVIRADNTWTNFYLSGSSVFELNNGTWHYGVPSAADAGARNSSQR